ncbi:DegT/DnrJ/EryC1/StrS family aminotransferase [Halobellus litoreus]|uniref:DegT/DnrJ/EryC1/StrS family aminotransferase n=1 Tax=Halobellus litoreus TaxID=755310 RepID=A0ABD6DUM0_9EURY|nr:DegT/DnrJ/EryC1/StrS family aminotransferase [Halobellus litoreus]
MVEEVPFTDIYMDDEMIQEVEAVLESGRYVKGPVVESFETSFAEQCGTDYAVGVNSGTSAILLGLQSLGIGEGDDVFVPGHTYFASVSPVLELGANPIFVDVLRDTYTMDTDDLEAKVDTAENPTAVIPVHLYGQMVEMDRVTEIADEYDLGIVADACQAHFAERNGRSAGSIADVGAFSFYPSKNMTVAGDGGMLVTDDAELAERARALRNHGRDDDGVHRHLGLNHRMSEMLAAVGKEQLQHIEEWNEGRRRAARHYDERLGNIDTVRTPEVDDENSHVYHLYVVQVPDRDGFREYLADNDVDTGIHYPTPAHEHPAVVDRVGETTVERAEELCDSIVSLPMHPRLSEEEVEYVCDLIAEYYE